ncbi:MAG: glycosyltransferase N-terminal domain-containing protein [candidate division Zixibacteria bacterium]|nr:glycosyltransferase N-terminal domain-containing protein [candidate division Zixibacteria bacterium]
MLFLYHLFTSLIYAIVFPVIRLKAAYGNIKWQHRLGLISDDKQCDVWLHASSVGEVKIVSYLLKYLSDKRPELKLRLTVMTETGFRVAKQLDISNLVVGYLPLDCRRVVQRTMDAIKPSMVVIAETEIWPALIMETGRRNIPLILINGRMSKNAFGRYRRLSSAIQRLLEQYDYFFLKTEQDAVRYRHLGATVEKSEIAGDMKFDAPLMPRSEGRRNEIRHRLGVNESDFLIVAGSTREGEESLLLQALSAYLVSENSDVPAIRLVFAPRHTNRIDDVKQVCIDAGVRYSIYSHPDRESAVILVDRMGLLNELYTAADISFVGGTLVDIGGHNLLEPVWAGTPVLFGPYLSNVLEAAEYIIDNNYGARVSTAQELADVTARFQLGKIEFAVKSENDLANSATTKAGKHILDRLENV